MFPHKLVAAVMALALYSSWASPQSLNIPTAPSFDLASRQPVTHTFALPPFKPADTFFTSSSLDAITSPSAESGETSGSVFFPKKQTAQEEANSVPGLRPQKKYKNSEQLQVHPFSTVAFGVRAGTLGAGVEIATPLSRSTNLRASANYMSFRYSFQIDGISYYTRADFRSGQLGIDWFPFHNGFHISPGYMYFNTGLAGAVKVSPAQSFTLDATTYTNSVDDPVGGAASIKYTGHYAPVLTFGFFNIIPRTGGHFSMPVEFGAAYTHAPVMAVTLDGTACTIQGCFNAGSDAETQANLKRENADLNESVGKLPLYPIATLGFAIRF